MSVNPAIWEQRLVWKPLDYPSVYYQIGGVLNPCL